MTWIIFWQVLDCQFVNWDDDKYVVENSPVKAGITWDGLRWALVTGHASNWHPATWVSHMLDCELWGLRPKGHHVGNLLLHALNTALLFGLLRQMTGTFWRGALVAALFAWHPLHVESVAWISERKDLLSTFFWLLSAGSYVGYVRSRTTNRRRSKVYYAASLLFYVAGLASKPMLVTLPFLLLLLDYWPLDRIRLKLVADQQTWNLVREKWPFFVLSLAACVVTFAVQHAGGAVASFTVVPFWMRGFNAMVSYVSYLDKMVWPFDLCALYPYPTDLRLGTAAGAVTLLLGVSILAVRWRDRQPQLLVGWFWFVGTLVPVIGLVQVGEQAMADRYTYVPLVGVFIMIAWSLGSWVAAVPRMKPVVIIGALVVLGWCAHLTREQVRYWQDGVTLFTRVIAVTENNATAHNVLGLALAEKDPAEAIPHYKTALQINPQYGLAHNNLGVAFSRLGQRADAIRHFEAAIQLNPNDPEPHFNLANAFNPGFTEEPTNVPARTLTPADLAIAEEHYRYALRLAPDHIKTHLNLGNLKAAQNDFPSAITHYQHALRIDRTSWAAQFNLANALARSGQPQQAVSLLTRLREQHPENLQIQLRLANLLAGEGKYDQAVAAYQIVLALEPERFSAWNDLGSALARSGRLDEAKMAYTRAIELYPDYVEAHLNLGSLRFRETKFDEAAAEFNRALKLAPQNNIAHHQLALVYMKLNKLDQAMPHFTEAVRLQPTRIEVRLDLALALARVGNYAQASAQYEAALELKPDSVPAMNNLAWLLATAPQSEARNGQKAVTLAQRACELTQQNDPTMLGTLDAAYAEAGDFDNAFETATRAYQLAKDSGRTETADAILNRLKLYREKKPWHQPLPTVEQQP